MKVLQSLKIFFLKTTFITKFLGWYGLYEFVNQGPTKARHISFVYLLTHRKKDLRQRLINELMSDPDCADVITQRQHLKIDLTEFENHEGDTLGKRLHLHMRNNNLTFVVPLDAPIHSDFQYIIHRILITHEIYHTILGAQTTAYGEAMVAAFTYSQITAYAPALVHVSVGSLHCAVVNNGLIDRSNLGIVTGWLLGKSTKQLFSVDWNLYWNTPLEEIRKILNIDLEKIHTAVKQLYTPERSLFSKIPGIPTTLEEQLNNNFCVQDIFNISVQKNTSQQIKIQSFTPEIVNAIVILGRAMFTTGKYLAKLHSPSLTSCLLQHGIQVLIPVATHQENHGFDEMVSHTDEYIKLAQALQPDKPIFLIGHSLSGLCFLAHQGLGSKTKINGVVTLGTATWNRENIKQEDLLFQTRLLLITKVIQMFLIFGNFVPARLLGYGDHDEHQKLVQQVTLDNMTNGEWKSFDKTINYYQNLSNIVCPVLCVASKTDKYSPLSQVNKLHANLPKLPDTIITDKLGHMELGTSKEAWDVWEKIALWIKSH